MNDFTSYINPELGIIICALWFVGLMFKKIKWISDEYIPILLGVVSVTFVSLYYGVLNINSVLQGLLCTAASVYGNQVYKQLHKTIETDLNTNNTKPVGNSNAVNAKDNEQKISGL
jgi:hypothetical protein